MRHHADEDDLDDDDFDDDFDDDDDDQTVPCPYCHEAVFDDAERCPHCGNYLNDDERHKRPAYWVLLGVVLSLLIIIGWMLVRLI